LARRKTGWDIHVGNVACVSSGLARQETVEDVLIQTMQLQTTKGLESVLVAASRRKICGECSLYRILDSSFAIEGRVACNSLQQRLTVLFLTSYSSMYVVALVPVQ
jgi:hypothetical protein